MPDERDELLVLMRLKLPYASFEQCRRLAGYLRYVLQYREVQNLTGAQRPRQIADMLVVESLKLLELADIAADWRVADLGSGNGSPVVPLALLCTETHFTAVESRQRRAAFLETVRAGLGLGNLEVYGGLSEDLISERPGGFDMVTSRAYAPPEKMLRHAGQLACAGGQVRGFTGNDMERVRAGAAACGLEVAKELSYGMHDEKRHVYLVYNGKPRDEPRQVFY